MPKQGRIDILDVGQCGFDGPRMAALWQEQLNAHVTRVSTAKEALAKLESGSFNLILVNRIFASDGDSGIEAIPQIKAQSPKTPIMLVSDLSEAQDEAVAAGALRGFGKQDLEEPQTLELVRNSAGQ